MKLSQKIKSILCLDPNIWVPKSIVFKVKDRADLFRKFIFLGFIDFLKGSVRGGCRNLSNVLALFESNQVPEEFVFYGLDLKNYNFVKKISMVVLPVLLDEEYLDLLEPQPDFHTTLEFIIFLHLNIYYPWISSSIAVNHHTKQLGRIKNKKMQNIWLENTVSLHEDLFSLSQDVYFNKLQYSALRGMNWDVKGRAVNLERVELRKFSTDNLYNAKFITENHVYSCYAMDRFVTKWGSTSCRISFVYNSNNGTRKALYRA